MADLPLPLLRPQLRGGLRLGLAGDTIGLLIFPTRGNGGIEQRLVSAEAHSPEQDEGGAETSSRVAENQPPEGVGDIQERHRRSLTGLGP